MRVCFWSNIEASCSHNELIYPTNFPMYVHGSPFAWFMQMENLRGVA